MMIITTCMTQAEHKTNKRERKVEVTDETKSL